LKVVCFYSKLAPECKKALGKFAPDCKYEDTSADDYAYWRLLKAHWTGVDDLLVIEQDIEITAEVLPSFDDCEEPWCVYEYKQTYKSSVSMLKEALGCTRFSAELQRTVPFPRAAQWKFLDLAISGEIKMVTFQKTGMVFYPGMKGASGLMASHVHGEVKHHHPERHL
jgi:hypothetical protein